jgi:hypothetical protein
MQQFKGGSMMKKFFQHIPTVRLVSLFVGLLILITPLSLALAGPKAPRIKVMTRNLYLGADIFKVVEAAQNPDPANYGLDVPMAVADIFQTMLYTNFWARAEALADEIMYADPEIIGLQEVSTFYIQSPGDFFVGNPVQADTVVINFYEVLNAALEARGLYYTAYITKNSDIEMPMLTGLQVIPDPPYIIPSFDDARMVDHDVILVKANYPSQQVLLDNYQNNLSLDIAGNTITFTRGFGIVDVDVKGTTFRFVNTHLEVRSSPGSVFRVFQSAQMFELLTLLSATDPELPVILVGDFNSSMEDILGTSDIPGLGEVPYVPPYMQAVGAGYLDTWLEQYNPNKPIFDDGYTSGFEETIDDPFDTLETRIDLVFLKAGNLELKRSRCEVVGNEPADMVENLPDYPGMYLWPSDHAGVVARLMFERP